MANFSKKSIACFKTIFNKGSNMMFKDTTCQKLLTAVSRIRYLVIRVIEELKDNFDEDKIKVGKTELTQIESRQKKYERLVSNFMKYKYNQVDGKAQKFDDFDDSHKVIM